ncbi:MAG: ketoacyl-ACP synthase III [Smithella sp.]
MNSPKIKAISIYLPDSVLTNDILEREFSSWSADKIFRKTGIMKRHIALKETTSEMAIKAAENLFKENNIDRNSIDFMLLCTQSPDYFLPTTACIVQNKLFLNKSTGALDFNLGCSGYIYGLFMASSFIRSGFCKNILLLTTEKYSRYIHPKDRGTRTIFGDAATATLISETGWAQIETFDLGTDGSGAENLIVPAGGDAMPHSAETSKETEDDVGNVRSRDNIYMNGPEIFNFTLEAVPQTISNILNKSSLKKTDIDYFIFHQANSFMLETLRVKMEIPESKFIVDICDYGNTVSNTIPIALKHSCDNKRFNNGSKILLTGFGVGYSWGSVILRYEEDSR